MVYDKTTQYLVVEEHVRGKWIQILDRTNVVKTERSLIYSSFERDEALKYKEELEEIRSIHLHVKSEYELIAVPIKGQMMISLD